MAAWCDSDEAYDRAEAMVDDHLSYDGTTDYDWQQPEATVTELCAVIDNAVRVFSLLADETHDLTEIAARRVA